MENDVFILLRTSFLTPAWGLGSWNNSRCSVLGSAYSYEKLLDFFFVIKLAEPAELVVLQLLFLRSVQKDKL